MTPSHGSPGFPEVTNCHRSGDNYFSKHPDLLSSHRDDRERGACANLKTGVHLPGAWPLLLPGGPARLSLRTGGSRVGRGFQNRLSLGRTGPFVHDANMLNSPALTGARGALDTTPRGTP